MKILVCGGTGVVGSAIAKKLVEQGHDVRILTRKIRKSTHSKIKMMQGNVSDSPSLRQAMHGCDAVVNAVQFDNAPFENPSKNQTYEKVDAQGTESIIDAARVCGVKHILYMSGAGTAEEKREPWFRAKWRAEQAIRNSGMSWTIFRPSIIYGPHDKSLNRLILMLRFSPIVVILGKGYRMQPIFIADMAHIVAKSIDQSVSKNQIYELAGPEALTMNEILKCAANILRKKRLFINIPKPVAGLLFSLLEKIPGIPVTRESLEFLTMENLISNIEQKKVEKDFSIELKTLNEGLQTYLLS